MVRIVGLRSILCVVGAMFSVILFLSLLLANRREERQLKGWMYVTINYLNGNALL